jgi:hypothetical protein
VVSPGSDGASPSLLPLIVLVLVIVLVFFRTSARGQTYLGVTLYGKGNVVSPGSDGASPYLPTGSSTLRFLSWEFFTLGLGKIFELFFGHRLGHLLRRAFEAGFAGFAAFGCQCCACGHLLFFRFRRHTL